MTRLRTISLLVFICSGIIACADWHDPDASNRIVFTRSDGPEASVLVSAPFESDTAASARAFRSDGREVPVKIVHQSGTKLHAIVRTGPQQRSHPYTFNLYYGTGLRERHPELLNMDTEPITVKMFNLKGKSLPTNWEKMRYLISTAGIPVLSRTKKTTDDIDTPRYSGYRTSWNHSHRQVSPAGLVRVSTHIIVPKEGLYRFAVDCNDAAFVLVDRKVAASWPGRHPAGEWRSGSLIFLEAGPHSIDIYGASVAAPRAKVGIAEAGEKEKFVRLENYELVTAASPRGYRLEQKDKTLHAGFAYTLGRPYKFRGMEQTFVPVVLEDFSSNDLSWRYTTKWIPGKEGSAVIEPAVSPMITGETELAGQRVTCVFDGMGLHRMSVVVRDPLGFVSTLEREIDSRNLQYREYAVSAVPTGIFPCQYVDDIVEPAIRIASQGENPLGFRLSWRWTDHEGRQHGGRSIVGPSSTCVVKKMFSAHAGDIETVTWELSHKGYRIDGGAIEFCSFPFSTFPVRAEEDRIYDNRGNQLVYVSCRAAREFRQKKIRAFSLKAGVTCLDDTLSGVRPLSGTDADITPLLANMLSLENASSISLEKVSAYGDQQALGTAALLVDVANRIRDAAGVAVMSIGSGHLRTRGRPDEYERILSVLADFVLSRRTLRAVLVTVPPVASSEVKSREYAAAARRVADARGIPVADLYSGFMGTGEAERRLFEGKGPELSDEGLNLAAQIIARSILSGYRSEDEE